MCYHVLNICSEFEELCSKPEKIYIIIIIILPTFLYFVSYSPLVSTRTQPFSMHTLILPTYIKNEESLLAIMHVILNFPLSNISGNVFKAFSCNRHNQQSSSLRLSFAPVPPLATSLLFSVFRVSKVTPTLFRCQAYLLALLSPFF